MFFTEEQVTLSEKIAQAVLSSLRGESEFGPNDGPVDSEASLVCGETANSLERLFSEELKGMKDGSLASTTEQLFPPRSEAGSSALPVRSIELGPIEYSLLAFMQFLLLTGRKGVAEAIQQAIQGVEPGSVLFGPDADLSDTGLTRDLIAQFQKGCSLEDATFSVVNDICNPLLDRKPQFNAVEVMPVPKSSLKRATEYSQVAKIGALLVLGVLAIGVVGVATHGLGLYPFLAAYAALFHLMTGSTAGQLVTGFSAAAGLLLGSSLVCRHSKQVNSEVAYQPLGESKVQTTNVEVLERSLEFGLRKDYGLLSEEEVAGMSNSQDVVESSGVFSV